MKLILASALVLAAAPALAETKIYETKGMHCGACVAMAKAEVCKLPGVESCKVELNKITLTGAKLDDAAVKTSVAKLGDEYSVVSIEEAGAAQADDRKPNPGPTLNKPAPKGKAKGAGK